MKYRTEKCKYCNCVLRSDNYTSYSKEEPKPAKPPAKTPSTGAAEEDKRQEEDDSLVITAEADGELNSSKLGEEEKEGEEQEEAGDEIEILPQEDNEYELYAKFWQVQDYFRCISLLMFSVAEPVLF